MNEIKRQYLQSSSLNWLAHLVAACIWSRRWKIALVLALLAGMLFRLIWLYDMEYKSDEAWTFVSVSSFLHGTPPPLIGMPSSVGIPNAGLSIWLFLGLGLITHADTPTQLARAVQIINVIALLLLLWFVVKGVEKHARELWLWAVALVAVNPISVLFARKIWASNLFPIFSVTFFACWWQRSRWWGALGWGLIGALLGQIQLGGFLFAAGFFLVTLAHDRKGVRWRAWLIGTGIGILPMLPWISTLLHNASLEQGWHFTPRVLWFFPEWLAFASGLHLLYPTGRDFLLFLSGPRVGGIDSHLAGLAFVITLGLWLWLLGAGLSRWRTAAARSDRLAVRSNTSLALQAAGVVYGLLYILVARKPILNYLIIAFPLPALSLVWLAAAGTTRPPRRRLTALVTSTAALTAAFLFFLHSTPHIHGDYGTPYREQLISPCPESQLMQTTKEKSSTGKRYGICVEGVLRENLRNTGTPQNSAAPGSH